MVTRRTGGDETWFRLREWTRSQKDAERLSSLILSIEGYSAIDPVHPLGGPDGLKDVFCSFDNKRWIGAVYFPKGQKSYSDIKTKFMHDIQGVSTNSADGMAFITNQELTLGEREELKDKDFEVDIFHLERITQILNKPVCYGIRLEFLDIEMTKEEQLAFNSITNEAVERLCLTIDDFMKKNKPEMTNEQYHTPIYISPVSNSIAAASILGGTRIHKCSYCGFGYFVNIAEYRITLTTPSIGLNSITCPKCGNSEPYY